MACCICRQHLCILLPSRLNLHQFAEPVDTLTYLTVALQSVAQCMPAGEARGLSKKGGSFSAGVRRAFSSFTGGSRKVLCSNHICIISAS